MLTESLFILALHFITGAISLFRALRDGLSLPESLQWGGIGFISGLVGLIARARTDRRHIHYMDVVQDCLLNLGLEVIALFGVPHLMT
jgi:hypothetical protein